MSIAILGFDSLVNQPYSSVYNKELSAQKPVDIEPISGDFKINADSPFVPAKNLILPIRLGRISSSGTVLCPGASDEKVFYAQSKFENLDEAIKNLREREGN